jgi:hypothetical protein
MASERLIIEFGGRCMIRQPTDPDPYDERRGVSGYTFAFGDEPDLNRIIYFQPHPDYPVRSHCAPIGVRVTRAFVPRLGGAEPVPALDGAAFDLLGDPVLENRNWNLTRPGYEPIVPFHVAIRAADGCVAFDRPDVLDPEHPDAPIWETPLAALETKGARGLAFEPSTVGRATGIYDYFLVAKTRRTLLAADRDALEAAGAPPDDPRRVVLDGRIHEFDAGISAVESGRPDRRTGVNSVIERFGYDISGKPGRVEGDASRLPGPLDLSAKARWRIDFWMGGWDFDALTCQVEGTLQIPFALATT